MALDYFRPKARHIFTIGRDLIKDDFSALIELVKNSYDADAEWVEIDFSESSQGDLVLTVKDDGHGMSETDIRGKWLIPSNDNKKKDGVSPKGRKYQGQKGVGRYAASVLGDILSIDTISAGMKTSIKIDWNDFSDEGKFLDEVPLDIRTTSTSEKSGTSIGIVGDSLKLSLWKDSAEKRKKLITEFRKLKPPFEQKDKFDIKCRYFGEDLEIEHNELTDFYDYRISGTVSPEGEVVYVYSNADTKEKIESVFNVDKALVSKIPGKFDFSFSVADQDSPFHKREEISRQFGRNTPRKEGIEYFKTYAGISIYRGGFRIRPYGEPNEDWLDLNTRRYNNPTFRLSSNQVLGYVTVGTEEESHLIEASSRERLKENEYFEGLKDVIRVILGVLEEKRYDYRGAYGIRGKKEKEFDVGKRIEDIQKEIDSINSEEDKNRVKEGLNELSSAFQKEKARLENIISQYEGQVTLGKLLGVTFHETSKPTKFIRENIPNIESYIRKIEVNLIGGLGEFGENLLSLLKGYAMNAKIISDFMGKNLEPLVRGKGRPKDVSISECANRAVATLESELKEAGIILENHIDPSISVRGYERDFLIAFVNFLDNSIYWIKKKDADPKRIVIETARAEDGALNLYFKDTGLGIINVDPSEYSQLFEPGFTRKETGSGLGLSIAGEVLERNGVRVEVLEKDDEFSFILKLSFGLCPENP